MTELSFAKSFLSTLDSRPIKLPADHAADPKTFEPKGPYTLPRMPHPMRRAAQSATAPGSDPALNISLKSLRNPPLDVSLSAQPYTTTVLELKQAVAEKIGSGGIEKIRLLFKKKPVADSKTVKDLLGEETVREVEFGVMVMGWAGGTGEEKVLEDGSDVKMADAPVAQGVSGIEVLRSDDFWEDLKGFLVQRVRNQEVAEGALEIFQEVWREKDGK